MLPSKTLKVLHIAPTPFFSDRGCHIRIRNEVEALEQAGVRVVVATYHHGNSPDDLDLRRIAKIPGYTRTSAGYSPYRFVADGMLLQLVMRILKHDQPDLMHAHLHEGALVGWMARKLLGRPGIPLIMDMQGSLGGELAAYNAFGPFTLLLRGFQKIEQWVCRMPDFFFCSSTASRDLLLADFGVSPSCTRLVKDIIPGRFFSPPKTHGTGFPHPAPDDSPTVIYTGSLLEGKGLSLLLEAMARVLQDRPGVKFVLLGYPHAQAAQFLEKLGWTNRCDLPGQVPYDQLPQWLSRAHLAIEPKIGDSGEASGKLIHYMAAGLPVACFRTPNNWEILGANGYYAGEQTARALARAILRVLDDPHAGRHGGQGRSRVARKFAPEVVADRMVDIYQRLLHLR